MEMFKTPKAKQPRRSLLPSTPKESTPVKIPASPFMEKVGWGTNVSVYRLERSPKVGCLRSPWAIKRVIHRKSTSNKTGDRPRRSINHEISDRLCKEAEILRSLNHPNIVGFRAFTESPDGRFTLAMEDGQQSLLSVIELRLNFSEELHQKSDAVEYVKPEMPFPPWAVLRAAQGLCSALSYLHNDALLLHGDIKSDNVLIIGDFDVIKLCDFGVTLKVDKNGVVLDGEEYIGTRHWLPPEVLESEIQEIDWEEGDDPIPKITTQADMYPYALTLWEMLSLSFPHCPTTGSEEEKQDSDENDLLGTRPPFPSMCLEDKSYTPIVELVHCCTDKVPEMRPTSKQALEFLEAIEKSGAMKKSTENQENMAACANISSD